jgi:hypothetical protein
VRPAATSADPGRSAAPAAVSVSRSTVAGTAGRATGSPARTGTRAARVRGLAACVAAVWALGVLPGGLLADTPAGGACAAPPGFAPRGRLESGGVRVLFRTDPAIAVGQHFTVDAVLCAPTPGTAVTGLRVDAWMPEHGHGMNYRAAVTPQGGGRYLAEGLLFHMPGRWELRFDVEIDGRVERLAAEVVLE